MKTFRVLFSAFALLLVFSFSSYALESKCKCVVVGPAASDLQAISTEAASAQTQADEMEAYLRSSASPDWENLASQMAYLDENIQHLQKLVARFEQSEPTLTEAQNQQLERLKAGLATLTVFANNTNQLIGKQQLMPYRDDLMSSAEAMRIRAGIIRDAARKLRRGAVRVSTGSRAALGVGRIAGCPARFFCDRGELFPCQSASTAERNPGRLKGGVL